MLKRNFRIQIRKVADQIPKHFVSLIISLICITPFLFALMTSFKTRLQYLANPYGLPVSPTLASYLKCFQETQFLLWFINSTTAAAGSSIGLGLAASILAAYAIVRGDFFGRRYLFRAIISLMALPSIVILVPLFRQMAFINFVNTYHGIILIYSGLIIPFSVYLLVSFFISVPVEIEEAALIDGCSSFQILTRVYVPISKPAIITCAVVNFVWVWNELLIAMVFMQGERLRTLMPGILSFAGYYVVDIPTIAAGLVVVSFPMLIIYLGGLKFFVKGMLTGFLK